MNARYIHAKKKKSVCASQQFLFDFSFCVFYAIFTIILDVSLVTIVLYSKYICIINISSSLQVNVFLFLNGETKSKK